MSSFEAQIEKSRQELAEGKTKIAELSTKIETARSKMKQFARRRLKQSYKT